MKTLRFAAVAALLLVSTFGVRAGDHGARVAPIALYLQECGSCHLAFPPGLLPAASWQRLMGDLPRHFGTDASLAAAERDAIARWLHAHAGQGKRAAEPPQDRITRARWFEREHDEVGAATWSRKSVGSASNCAACHTDAERGGFSERAVRIPR